MRRPSPLTLLAALLALVSVVAVGSVVTPADAGLAPAGASAGASGASSGGRAWTITLAAQPNDLALAEVRFRPPRGKPTSAVLHVAVKGPFGADYLAVAAPRGHARADAWVLILLVNRPSALLDPASVRMTVSAPSSLGAHIVLRSNDPFARAVAAKRPSLCAIRAHGSSLGAGALRRLQSRGAAIGHFSVPGAVAQAYDAVCGRTVQQAFRQAVTGPATSPAPQPTPNPSPAPSPTPTPVPPGCRPCLVPPRSACPDHVAAASICVGAARGLRTLMQSVAH